ncbi:hypothetical protein QBC47DRAFT_129811 [Echria macrotheca]|uniref:Uncharacterized protein n=1 Tax=Echria macrotheca TaxID=438768 RepID=A0AAJ0B1D1_9PEZI|nr:hypothetical protein QBC47DRAFT_129811 [Echria macrotheca]
MGLIKRAHNFQPQTKVSTSPLPAEMATKKTIRCDCGKHFADARFLEQHRHHSFRHKTVPSNPTASTTETTTNKPSQQTQTKPATAAKRAPSQAGKREQPATATKSTTTTGNRSPNVPSPTAELLAIQARAQALFAAISLVPNPLKYRPAAGGQSSSSARTTAAATTLQTKSTLQCCGRTFRAPYDLEQHRASSTHKKNSNKTAIVQPFPREIAAATAVTDPAGGSSGGVKAERPAAAVNPTTAARAKDPNAEARRAGVAELLAAQAQMGPLPMAAATTLQSAQCCGRTFRAPADLARHQTSSSHKH